jgi:hypothetical protein
MKRLPCDCLPWDRLSPTYRELEPHSCGACRRCGAKGLWTTLSHEPYRAILCERCLPWMRVRVVAAAWMQDLLTVATAVAALILLFAFTIAVVMMVAMVSTLAGARG